VSNRFSLSYHIIGPFIASIILFIFIFLLQDLLLLRDIFNNENLTYVSFIVLWIGLMILGWILPTISLPEVESDVDEAK